MKRRPTGRAGAVAALCLAALFQPAPAAAHLVNTRFGNFYDGMLHPLTAMEHMIPWLAIGLLAGPQPKAGRWMLLTFPIGLALGTVLPVAAPGFGFVTAGDLGAVFLLRAFVAYGRFMPTRGAGVDVTYVGEGLTASIAVSRQGDGILTYHNAGKAQASTYPEDMRLQRMLGHLTTLVPTRARSVMVIGCGAGVTAGAVSIDPEVEELTIVEIEPLVPEVVSREFGMHNFEVVDNPSEMVQAHTIVGRFCGAFAAYLEKRQILAAVTNVGRRFAGCRGAAPAYLQAQQLFVEADAAIEVGDRHVDMFEKHDTLLFWK